MGWLLLGFGFPFDLGFFYRFGKPRYLEQLCTKLIFYSFGKSQLKYDSTPEHLDE